MSRQRTRADGADIAERLRGDRVFAIAQVTLLVKLMLTVLVLDAQSIDAFTLPKSVAGHATSLVLAALLVWLLARHGRALLRWSPIHFAAGGLLLAFAVATPLALDPVAALFGTYRRYLGLTQMLDNVLLYVAVGTLFRDTRSLRLLAGVGIGTAVPVLAYAFLQRADLDPLKFQRPTTIPITTLGNPDIAGAYLSMVGITAIGFAFLLGDRISRAALVALSLIGAAAIAALYFTGVRAGILGIGGGWIATLALLLRLPGDRRGSRIAFAALGAFLAAAVVFSPIAGRLRLDAMRSDVAVLSRIEIWVTAEKAIADRPLLGLGPDNFAAFYPANRPERSVTLGELQNSTHDLWLYVATSAGVVGLAALLVLVAMLIERALRMARRGEPGSLALVPLLAYLGQSLVGINDVGLDWVFWVSAGVIAAAGATPLRQPGVRRQRTPRAAFVGTVALAAAVAAIFVGVLPRLAVGEAMAQSEAYSNANRGAEALPNAEIAVSTDPRRAETWSVYGTALTRAGKLPAAVVAYTNAAVIQPWHPLSWRNLAIVWAQLDNRTSAIAAAERAVRADPYDGETHELLATLAYAQGDFARAASEGDLAIALGPRPEISAYYTTVSAYVQLKDLERAENVARAGVTRYRDVALLRLQLAAILADRGNRTEALAIVDAVLADQPTNGDAQQLRNALTGK